jgi:hypothetical protein
VIGLSGMTIQPSALAAAMSSSVGGSVWPRAAARAVIAAMTASKMSCDRRIACSCVVQSSHGASSRRWSTRQPRASVFVCL